MTFIGAIRKSNITIQICSGIIFIALFYWSYSAIPSDFYEIRDDGVITMSNAKNLIDFGFIGINPSGERVECVSSPVQFFLYALFYKMFTVSYDTFAQFQTLAFTFLLGFVFAGFFKEKKGLVIIISLLSAFLLSRLSAFIQWHGSGMENAITHTLFLSALYVLYSFARNRRINYSLSVIVFLATLSRLESIYHIGPLLVIFSIYWFITERNLKGLYFSVIVFVSWCAFHLGRYIYFGDLMPNTAYAQEIYVVENIKKWLTFDVQYIKTSLSLSKGVFVRHCGYLMLVATTMIFFIKKNKSIFFLNLLIASLIVTTMLHPFFFGQARLDAVRTLSHLPVLVSLELSLIIYYVRYRSILLWTLLTASFIFTVSAFKPYYMCCTIELFDPVRTAFAKTASAEDLPRPTVANPDIGIVSWHKQFNIVDLGMLGNPILAKLRNGTLVADYFFDFAAPDMIEAHGMWSCRYYDSIFSDTRFPERYSFVKKGIETGHTCEGKEAPEGIWVRNDIKRSSQSAERRLIDDVKDSLSTNRLASELSSCQAGAERDCVYVARTAYRFLPEFIARGEHEELLNIFETSKTRDYDLYLLNGFSDGQAHMKAIGFISARASERK